MKLAEQSSTLFFYEYHKNFSRKAAFILAFQGRKIGWTVWDDDLYFQIFAVRRARTCENGYRSIIPQISAQLFLMLIWKQTSSRRPHLMVDSVFHRPYVLTGHRSWQVINEKFVFISTVIAAISILPIVSLMHKRTVVKHLDLRRINFGSFERVKYLLFACDLLSLSLEPNCLALWKILEWSGSSKILFSWRNFSRWWRTSERNLAQRSFSFDVAWSKREF